MVGFCFWLVVRNFHIRLRFRLEEQGVALRRILVLLNSTRTRIQNRNPLLWIQYHFVHCRLVHFHTELEVYSKFWARLVSTYLAGHVILVTYCAYSFALKDSAGLQNATQQWILVFFTLMYFSMILFNVAQCGAIVTGCEQMFRMMRRVEFVLNSATTLNQESKDTRQLFKVGFVF